MRVAVLLAVVLMSAASSSAAPPNARAIASEQADAGRVAFARGDLEEAQRRFQEAFATFGSPSYLLDIAEVQLKMHRDDRAIESMKRFLKLAGSDPTQAELAQHVRMRVAELERRAAPPPSPPGSIDPVDEPGPEGVRAAIDSRTSGRRPFVDAIDDSTRAPVVNAIDDRPETPPRIELAAPAPAPPAPRRGLRPWEVGLISLGVVAGLVLTFAPIVYYTAPPLHNDVFSPNFGAAPLR